jgi:hypothetical protein
LREWKPPGKARGFLILCAKRIRRGAKVLKSKILPLRPQIVPLPEAKNVPPFSPNWRMVGIDNCINAVHREINSFVCFPPLVISKKRAGKVDHSQLRVTGAIEAGVID